MKTINQNMTDKMKFCWKNFLQKSDIYKSTTISELPQDRKLNKIFKKPKEFQTLGNWS